MPISLGIIKIVSYFITHESSFHVKFSLSHDFMPLSVEISHIVSYFITHESSFHVKLSLSHDMRPNYKSIDSKSSSFLIISCEIILITWNDNVLGVIQLKLKFIISCEILFVTWNNNDLKVNWLGNKVHFMPSSQR